MAKPTTKEPRKKKERIRRKTNKGIFSSETMKSAVDDVLRGRFSLRQAGDHYELAFKTIQRYVNKQKAAGDVPIRMISKYNHRTIFSEAQEQQLVQFLMRRARALCGVTILQLREMAYTLAVENGLKIPASWHANKLAGRYWLYSFRDRNPDLALRSPQRCSLARLTSFTKENISLFFENLKTLLEKYPQIAADGSRIFNLDETGVTTVMSKATKVFAEKGSRNVHAPTAAERGSFVTVCAIVGANGSFLPPAMVFPRVHFQSHMLNEAIPGTLGLAKLSGWMTADLFLKVLEHFIKFTRSSKEDPTILILDNHESHVSIEALEYAKENGIHMLTLPPHCSGKMQPLDVSVFSSFKGAYNKAVENWQVINPLKVANIYNVAEFVKTAFMKSFTPANITSGFEKTGIYKFNDQIFDEFDFLEYFKEKFPTASAITTDLPDVRRVIENDTSTKSNSSETAQQHESTFVNQNLVMIPSNTNTSVQTSENEHPYVSPEDLFGYPTADAINSAKNTNKKGGRPRGSSKVMTSTPEIEKKKTARRDKEEKEATKIKRQQKRLEKANQKSKPQPPPPPRAKKQLFRKSDDEDSEIDGNVSFASSLSDAESFTSLEKPLDEEVPDVTNLALKTFVLVQFKFSAGSSKSKNSMVHYVGQIVARNKSSYKVNFLRKKKDNWFHFPQIPDESNVEFQDIVLVLPQPTNISTKATARQANTVRFEGLDLHSYNIK